MHKTYKHKINNGLLKAYKSKIISLAYLFLLIAYFTPTHKSYSQVVDSVYYGWTVYQYQNGDDKECYIVARPTKSNSSYTAKRDPYLAVTRYKADRTEEVSVYSGYEYKINSNVNFLIDDKLKQLFSKGDMAWAKSDYDDKEIIINMLEGEYLAIRSDSSTGDYAVDEYEMKGIARAYSRMRDLCR